MHSTERHCVGGAAELAAHAPGLRMQRGRSTRSPRAVYLRLLALAFALLNSLRMVAYLPTLALIWRSGDSSQHSLWTWLTWLGANMTMAAWLYEQDGGRLSRAALINIGNASMCLATVALIVWFRL